MKSAEFKKLLEGLSHLTKVQRDRLRNDLDKRVNADEIVRLLERNGEGHLACPRCGGQALYKWGTSADLQRYRCKKCLKTFNCLSQTPLARLRHKDKWLSYGQALIDGLPIRKAAAQCGVAKNTGFKWRHRFLQLPAVHKATKMSGIAEADETFFRESFKGRRHLPRKPRKRGGKTKRGTPHDKIPVLVVRDRHGAKADFIMHGVSARDIEPRLKPLLPADVILCTDGASAYEIVARHMGIEHHSVNVTRGIWVRKAYHIQNVNAYDRRLKQWMDRFHGVATRYLENHLGWRRMLERFGNKLVPKTCLYSALGIENPFQQLNTT